ncbi:hypothetical protein DsansV1_C03g0031871 [Dioscorea sansibarensis]
MYDRPMLSVAGNMYGRPMLSVTSITNGRPRRTVRPHRLGKSVRSAVRTLPLRRAEAGRNAGRGMAQAEAGRSAGRGMAQAEAWRGRFCPNGSGAGIGMERPSPVKSVSARPCLVKSGTAQGSQGSYKKEPWAAMDDSLVFP